MVYRIDKKIVGYKVLAKGKEEVIAPEAMPTAQYEQIIETIYAEPTINEKVKRGKTLSGSTYAIKPYYSDKENHKIYITINDIVLDGKKYPFEVFINSKCMESFQWISALTRMVSAVFRKGGDISFIVEEFTAIHTPQGGYWGVDHLRDNKKKYYNSIVQEIGVIIQLHLDNLESFNIAKEKRYDEALELAPVSLTSEEDAPLYPENAKECPECKTKAYVLMDGCYVCLDCGHSKCG